MKTVTMKTLLTFFATDGDKINEVKVTSFNRAGFNDMEGNKYEFNLKIFTTDKYKNLFLKVETNSSYLCDCEEYLEKEDIYNRESITEWLNATLA